MQKFYVVILAAGAGKRMRSSLPKVLTEVGGQPMLHHVLDAVLEAQPAAQILLVVGHEQEKVRESLAKTQRYQPALDNLQIQYVTQSQQLGTGDAAREAMQSDWGKALVKNAENLLILPGDFPLIRPLMIQQMLEPFSKGSVVRKLTTYLSDPTGYGRIIRKGKDQKGEVLKIVEHKDANASERSVQEVATSIYLFHAPFLQQGLKKLSNKNAQGEFYLTDLIEQSVKLRKKVEVINWMQSQDLHGVNDLYELAVAEKILNSRRLKKHAQNGVRIQDPDSIWVDASVELSAGVVLESRVSLRGQSKVGANSIIASGCRITDSSIGEDVEIKTGTVIEQSVVGKQCKLGPYAHLRPECRLGQSVKIGNFVELKKTIVDDRSSIAHLSYLGDASVGKNVNIGCGFVTCNYDGRVINGRRKHPTLIEDDVFVGSDCQAIAPIRLGRGSYIASGSTLTRDVPENDLAIARSKQVNKTGYAHRFRSPPATLENH